MTNRLDRIVRREAWVWDATFFLTVGWIVFGALPLLGILVFSLVLGNYPTDADPTPAGYPALTPPWWAMYPLVALQAAATAISFDLPLRGRRAGTRANLLLQSALVTVFTFLNGTVAFGREGTFSGTEWLVLVSVACIAAVALRIVAGALKMVPLSWREYLDDNGGVISPDQIVRPPARPWDGIGRLVDRSRRR